MEGEPKVTVGFFHGTVNGEPVTLLTEPYGQVPADATADQRQQYLDNFQQAYGEATDGTPLPITDAYTRHRMFGYLCANYDPRTFEDIRADLAFIASRHLRS